MQNDTFREWLTERGFVFELTERGKGGQGIGTIMVRRDGRRTELPLLGSKKDLDPDTVHRVVEDLGLDPSELPAPQSPV